MKEVPAMSMPDTERLAAYALFENLSPEEVQAIADCAAVQTCDPGQVVFEESSQSTDLFLLIDGRVSVEIEAPSSSGSEQLQLAVLREGEVFGEIAFLEGKRRSARISAVDGVTVLRFDGTRLYGLFDGNPVLGYRVMRNLAAVLAQRVVDVNFKWRQDRSGAVGRASF
ncbi:MAG: cyclic nucleotide-binding domain-containing protein [Chitinivibrionales bacterium]|nr:cyclic nucleotide-binding domain-containing protein [Chitinivibrionales bacterium]